MNKNQSKNWVGVVGRMLLAYALIFSQSALAGQKQKTTDKANSPQKATAQQATEKQSAVAPNTKAKAEEPQREPSETAVAGEKSSGGGSHEGIKVHGHWTIEVRNPDGTVVTHREFENSLNSASGILPTILARQAAVGSWQINMSSSTGGGLCRTGICSIAEIALSNVTPPPDSTNLTVAVQGIGIGVPTLTLNGSVNVGSAGAVAGVFTEFFICGGTIAPSACFSTPAFSSSGVFTLATLNSPVAVAAGQTLQVTVNITFS